MSNKTKTEELAAVLDLGHPMEDEAREAAAELRRLAGVDAEREILQRKVAEQALQWLTLDAQATELMAERDRLRAQVESINATANALRGTLHDELAENLRLRELGGAQADEGMTAFLERVFAERDRLAAEVDALRADAERYRAVRDDDCHPYGICIWDEDDGWAQDARKPDVVDAAIDAARKEQE